MEKVALYRKYRPHNFDNLVGQDPIKTTLINALKAGKVSHAYLFTGPRGTGKTSTARIIAKALNCSGLQDNYEPCDKCEYCSDINDGRLIDLIEIDAASNRGIDEVRDLKEKIQFAPTRGKVKIYIIDEVHMMTKEAFNALLKTLEEPPDHAYFILATTEVHKIPETIISRCQRFDFKRISNKAIMTRLSYIAQVEKIKVDDQVFDAISRYADGGLRDAIGLIEQLTVNNELKFETVQEVLGIGGRQLIDDLLFYIESNDTKSALSLIHTLHDQGSDLKQFIHEFTDFIREKMIQAANENDSENIVHYMRIIDVFQEAQNKISSATIPHLPLEIAVIKLAGILEKPIAMNPVERTHKDPESTMRAQTDENAAGTNDSPSSGIEDSALKPSAKTGADITSGAVTAETETDGIETHKNMQSDSAGAESSAGSTDGKSTNKDESDDKGISDSDKSTDNNSTQETVELTLESLKTNWPRITERIKSPSLRNSLKSAVPSHLKESTVTLCFNTKFHKNQVMEHDHRVELENIMDNYFGDSLKIVAEIKEIEIKPVVNEEQISQAVNPHENEKKQDVVDQALEIFGGEIL